MKETYKSFAELNKAVNKDPFAKFLEMSTQEKAMYLKERGITWGADYLGRYCEKSKTVIIDTLENPFTGKPIQGTIHGKLTFNDGAQVVVKLKTGKIEGQKSTPNNIFGFEYIGRLSKKRYIDMTANATITILQEENKKLKSKNDSLKERVERQGEEIAEFREENKNLRNNNKDLISINENLRKEREKAETNVAKAAQDLQIENKLLREQLSENSKLATIIIDRNITELLHVTRINNLESILDKGIVPVANLGPAAERNDYDRHDRKLECSSLSVSRVNSCYFRKAAERNPGQTYICIYIKPSILLDGNTKYYCHHNAATGSISYYTKQGFLTNAEDFEYMFADIVEYTTINGKVPRRRTSAHRDSWTTSDQAEILYEGIILPEQFTCVAFPTHESLESSMWLLNKYGLKGTVEPILRF